MNKNLKSVAIGGSIVAILGIAGYALTKPAGGAISVHQGTSMGVSVSPFPPIPLQPTNITAVLSPSNLGAGKRVTFNIKDVSYGGSFINPTSQTTVKTSTTTANSSGIATITYPYMVGGTYTITASATGFPTTTKTVIAGGLP